MAATEHDWNGNSKEASGHRGAGKRASGKRFPGVNFDEMNYEQRRAPYNSGLRTLSEQEHNQSRDGNNTGDAGKE